MRELKGLPKFYVITRSILKTNKFIDGHTLFLLVFIALVSLTTWLALPDVSAPITQSLVAED